MDNKITEKEYWSSIYGNMNFKTAKKSNPIIKWLSNYFEAIERGEKSCFELGCFPGTYLTFFGKLGYELNGLDYYSSLDQLRSYCFKKKYSVGEFYNIDLFDFVSDRKFDVVCSFGFIEHFIDWEGVLRRQMSFVGERGYLVLQVPNFSGTFQEWFHKKFDNENLAMHYLPSMNPDRWSEIVEAAGFEIFHVGYFGGFNLWWGREERPIFMKSFLLFVKIIKVIASKLITKDHKSYSPFIGLIAKRKT